MASELEVGKVTTGAGTGGDDPKVIVGGEGNAQLRARHIDGKGSTNLNTGKLFLNHYSTSDITMAVGGGNVGIACTPEAPFHTRVAATTSSTPLEVARLEVHDSGVNTVAGIGPKLSFYPPANIGSYEGASIAAKKESDTDAAQATTLSFSTCQLGDASPTERVTINSVGLASFSAGIAFTQTNSTAASNITTTLDHYERGVWTPVIADAATGGNTGSGSTVTGYYERIGNAVTVTGLATNVDTTGLTGSNVLFVRGLPFPAGYSSGTFGDLGRAVGSCVLDAVDLETSTRSVSTMIIGQNSYFTFHQIRDAVGDSNILVSNLSSGTADLFFTFTYFVD